MIAPLPIVARKTILAQRGGSQSTGRRSVTQGVENQSRQLPGARNGFVPEVEGQDPATDLRAPLANGPQHTVLREVRVVANHNSYHLGEFGILRQVMGSWGRRGGA